ncbi:MAG: hypothetical protein C3F11_04760 [Methylocystaceae bacterium]|nr:MAG: hypothetical protein C3F11_04760 [Methylocystaceae bacterium]
MAEALPIAKIVHETPGRTRLRVGDKRGDGAFFASVATGLSGIPGVYEVDVRPLTGSILIRHGAPLARIGSAAREARLLAVENGLSVPPPTSAQTIDPKMAIALGFCAFAVWQLTQGRVLPPAITLAWYAARLGGLLSVGDDDGE